MTFLNQETVDELRDLVSAKDYTVKQIQAARDAFVWTGPAADDWDRDWSALKLRYNAARVLAESAFTRAKMAVGVRDSLIPAPVEYDAILKAIRKTEGVETKGDLQELATRLGRAGARVDFSKTPQPKAVDVDLQVYKAADTVLPPAPSKNPWPWIGGGLALAGLGWLASRR